MLTAHALFIHVLTAHALFIHVLTAHALFIQEKELKFTFMFRHTTVILLLMEIFKNSNS